MHLYSDSFAPSPRRVRIFLAEKQLTVPTTDVGIASGGTRHPDFLALNPLGEVPVLVLDDGTRLTESIAICRYLEALHPEPNLFGTATLERAAIDQWTYRVMFRLYEPVRQLFRNTHRYWADRITQVPAYGEVARELALAAFAELDDVLATREYVALERYTFADIAALVAIDFGKPSGLRVTDAHPHLLRWHRAVSARPSAKA